MILPDAELLKSKQVYVLGYVDWPTVPRMGETVKLSDADGTEKVYVVVFVAYGGRPVREGADVVEQEASREYVIEVLVREAPELS